MRPRDDKGTRRSARRVRSVLKSTLGWLQGWPDGLVDGGVQWRTLTEPDRPQTIGRPALMRATRAARTLLREHRPALEAEVGDAGRWVERVEAQLERLKPAVHDGQAPRGPLEDGLPPRDAARLRRVDPELDRLVEALGWVRACRPEPLSAEIDWLVAHQAELRRVVAVDPKRAVPDGLRLLVLGATHRTRVDAFLALLSDPRVDAVPTFLENRIDVGQAVKKAKTGSFKPAELRGTPKRSPLAGLLARLPEFPPDGQRVALDAIALLAPALALDRWEPWWEELEVLARRGRRHAAGEGDGTLPADLRQHLSAVPDPIHPKELVLDVVELAQHPSLAPAMLKLARALTVGAPAAWINAAAHTLLGDRTWFEGSQRRFGQQVRAATKWLDVDPERAPTLRRRARLMGGRASRLSHPVLDLTDCPHPPARLTTALDVLFRVCASLPEDTAADLPVDPAPMLAVDPDPDACARRILSLSPSSPQWLSETDIVAATWLSLEEPEQFAACVQQLADCDHARPITSLAEALHEAGWTSALSEALTELGWDTVGSLAWSWVALRSGRPSIPHHPIDPPAPPWATDWPTDVRAAAALLSAVAPDAEDRARRLLGNELVARSWRQAQIDALGARLTGPDDPLHARVARLEALRDAPVSLSPAREQRAASRLRRAAGRSMVTALISAVKEAGDRQASRIFGFTSPPPWLAEARAQRILWALGRLEEHPAVPQLGRDLLRRRGGPPPWLPWDDPRNQAALETLRSRGLEVQPWLDGLPPRRLRLGGHDVTVELSVDPLEILEMGTVFNTCLSAGASNFFSAVMNAVDVNKRVLVARRDDGVMEARALLALTDAGGLLTFHPYSHDDGSEWSAAVGVYAGELAEAIGATPVPNGVVRPLLAKDWYDDGPRDLCARFPALLANSPLRRELETVEVDAVESLLETSLRPLGIHPLTLPMLLDLPELSGRPELLRLLMRHLVAVEHLPAATWMQAGRLARGLGPSPDVDAIVERGVQALRPALERGENWAVFNAVDLLRDRPRRLLALTRRMRGRGPGQRRRVQAARMVCEATAREKLGQLRRALELWRELEVDPVHGHDAEGAIGRLERLIAGT